MTSNPPPSTRSTTNDDQLSALEVSSHSLRRQVDGHKEELTAIREDIDALSNAVAKWDDNSKQGGIGPMKSARMTIMGMAPSIEIVEKEMEDLREAYKLKSLS